MALTDLVSDVITRIRNSQMARHSSVKVPYSANIVALLQVLKNEGYLADYSVSEVRGNIKEITVELKYYKTAPVITHIKRVSKPGRRVYKKCSEIKKFFGGLGISIISTPKGVMSDDDARAQNLGGEVWCNVY